MADTLVVGPRPASLELGYVLGDPLTFSLELTFPNGTPQAWPEAPVLEFYGTALAFPSTLSASVSGGVLDRATFDLTEAQVAGIHGLTSKKPRISVGGRTQFAGTVAKRA